MGRPRGPFNGQGRAKSASAKRIERQEEQPPTLPDVSRVLGQSRWNLTDYVDNPPWSSQDACLVEIGSTASQLELCCLFWQAQCPQAILDLHNLVQGLHSFLQTQLNSRALNGLAGAIAIISLCRVTNERVVKIVTTNQRWVQTVNNNATLNMGPLVHDYLKDKGGRPLAIQPHCDVVRYIGNQFLHEDLDKKKTPLKTKLRTKPDVMTVIALKYMLEVLRGYEALEWGPAPPGGRPAVNKLAQQLQQVREQQKQQQLRQQQLQQQNREEAVRQEERRNANLQVEALKAKSAEDARIKAVAGAAAAAAERVAAEARLKAADRQAYEAAMKHATAQEEAKRAHAATAALQANAARDAALAREREATKNKETAQANAQAARARADAMAKEVEAARLKQQAAEAHARARKEEAEKAKALADHARAVHADELRALAANEAEAAKARAAAAAENAKAQEAQAEIAAAQAEVARARCVKDLLVHTAHEADIAKARANAAADNRLALQAEAAKANAEAYTAHMKRDEEMRAAAAAAARAEADRAFQEEQHRQDKKEAAARKRQQAEQARLHQERSGVLVSVPLKFSLLLALVSLLHLASTYENVRIILNWSDHPKASHVRAAILLFLLIAGFVWAVVVFVMAIAAVQSGNAQRTGIWMLNPVLYWLVIILLAMPVASEGVLVLLYAWDLLLGSHIALAFPAIVPELSSVQLLVPKVYIQSVLVTLEAVIICICVLKGVRVCNEECGTTNAWFSFECQPCLDGDDDTRHMLHLPLYMSCAALGSTIFLSCVHCDPAVHLYGGNRIHPTVPSVSNAV